MSRIPYSSIKTAVQNILETANTTTGSPIDLSNSLSDRVKKVLQINVEKIPIQPSFFPCVTMFIDNKQVTLKDISRTMLQGRRQGDIDLKIIGLVWIDNMSTANFEYKDLADNECEQLMENVEEVLRNDPTLLGNALWSKPTDVTFHTYPVSEGSHMRAGVMNYKISVLY
jgi:hypothetical protein